jgi:hypothetical protein
MVQKEEFSKIRYMCGLRRSIFIRDKPIWSKRVLHKDCYHKGSIGKKKISGHGSQGT